MTITASPQRAPGLDLPAGRWHGPIWASDEPLAEPGRYRDHIAEFDRVTAAQPGSAALWPVLVPHDPRFAANGADWLDDRGSLAPATGHEIEAVDVDETLTRWWDPFCCTG